MIFLHVLSIGHAFNEKQYFLFFTQPQRLFFNTNGQGGLFNNKNRYHNLRLGLQEVAKK